MNNNNDNNNNVIIIIVRLYNKIPLDNKANLLWDFTIQTDYVIEVRIPDRVVLKEERDHT